MGMQESVIQCTKTKKMVRPDFTEITYQLVCIIRHVKKEMRLKRDQVKIQKNWIGNIMSFPSSKK